MTDFPLPEMVDQPLCRLQLAAHKSSPCDRINTTNVNSRPHQSASCSNEKAMQGRKEQISWHAKAILPVVCLALFAFISWVWQASPASGTFVAPQGIFSMLEAYEVKPRATHSHYVSRGDWGSKEGANVRCLSQHTGVEAIEIAPVLAFFSFLFFFAILLQWCVSKIPVYPPPVSIVWFVFGMAAYGVASIPALLPPQPWEQEATSNGTDGTQFRAPIEGSNILQTSILQMRFIDSSVVYFVMMPILLYEATCNINWHKFKRFLAGGLTLAVLGVALQVGILGVLFYYTFVNGDVKHPDTAWTAAFLLAATLSSTDPVAVLSVLNSVNASDKICTMFDGESLINDGSAVLLFQFFFFLLQGVAETPFSTFVMFVKLLFLGPAFGIAVGFACYCWLLFFRKNPMTQCLCFISGCYISYFLAEAFFSLSGPLTAVCYGLFVKAYGHIALDREAHAKHHTFVEALALMANCTIFVISGIVAYGMMSSVFTRDDGVIYWLRLLATYVYLNASRAAMIIIFLPILRRTGYGLTWKEAVLLVWGGLRGGIVLALGLRIERDGDLDPDLTNTLSFFISGSVFLILLVNGMTFELLYRLLNPYPPKPFRRVYLEAVMRMIDHQYHEDRQALENHWLFKGTDVLVHADRVVPALAWRKVDRLGNLDIRCPDISQAFMGLHEAAIYSWVVPQDSLSSSKLDAGQDNEETVAPYAYPTTSPPSIASDSPRESNIAAFNDPKPISVVAEPPTGAVKSSIAEPQTPDNAFDVRSAVSNVSGPAPHLSTIAQNNQTIQQLNVQNPLQHTQQERDPGVVLTSERIGTPCADFSPPSSAVSALSGAPCKMIRIPTPAGQAEGRHTPDGAHKKVTVADQERQAHSLAALGQGLKHSGSRGFDPKFNLRLIEHATTEAPARVPPTPDSCMVEALVNSDSSSSDGENVDVLEVTLQGEDPSTHIPLYRLTSRAGGTPDVGIPWKRSEKTHERGNRVLRTLRRVVPHESDGKFGKARHMRRSQTTLCSKNEQSRRSQEAALGDAGQSNGQASRMKKCKTGIGARETARRSLASEEDASVAAYERDDEARRFNTDATITFTDEGSDGPRRHEGRLRTIFSRKQVASALPWPATRRPGAHGQTGAPCKVEITDGFSCTNNDVVTIQAQHQVSVHEDMYQEAQPSQDNQAPTSRRENRVSTLGLPSPAKAVAARQARRMSQDAARMESGNPELAKAAAARAAGEVGRRRSSARSASVSSEPACLTTLEPEEVAMNELKRSLSLASSESYFDIPISPRRDGPVGSNPPPSTHRRKVLRKEREGELYLMIFNACREMYHRLYHKQCIGGSALLSLNTSLDLSNDFAVGKVRLNPIQAWAEVLKEERDQPSLRGRKVQSDLEQLLAFVDVHEELLDKGGRNMELLMGTDLLRNYKQQILSAKRFVLYLRDCYPDSFRFSVCKIAATLLLNLKIKLVKETASKGLVLEEDKEKLLEILDEQQFRLSRFRPCVLMIRPTNCVFASPSSAGSAYNLNVEERSQTVGGVTVAASSAAAGSALASAAGLNATSGEVKEVSNVLV